MMTMEHPFTLCSILIFQYVDFHELPKHLYQYNINILKSILYHIHKKKHESAICRTILHQKCSHDFIEHIPILYMKPFKDLVEYLFSLYQKEKYHHEHRIFLINKLEKLFYIQKINENTLLLLSELRSNPVSASVYACTLSKNFHSPTTSWGYVYKDNKDTPETSKVLSLL